MGVPQSQKMRPELILLRFSTQGYLQGNMLLFLFKNKKEVKTEAKLCTEKG